VLSLHIFSFNLSYLCIVELSVYYEGIISQQIRPILKWGNREYNEKEDEDDDDDVLLVLLISNPSIPVHSA